MGVSVAEGTIVEWLKRPGDWVDADETVAIVTTDKVDVEIPSPASGRLERILVGADETVAVGTALAEIDPAAKPGEPHPEEDHEPAAASEPRDPDAPSPLGDPDAKPDRSSFYSPVVRRIAERHGIDLAGIKGTGIGGRVRKRDLLARIENGGPSEERPLHIESPYLAEREAEAEPAAAPAGAETATETAGERREPMSPMRRQIAEHMLASRRTAAHCTTIVEVDMGRVAARRAELKEAMERRGVPLTYLAFVARATVVALGDFPVLYASV
ncbi:MAG TPA: biotin/lipoyl-containing protein, partial [Solirubrobacterales bacterium]|nr:biotin/lipoyl-containing protein [Solirubrobacterales bacterium]